MERELSYARGVAGVQELEGKGYFHGVDEREGFEVFAMTLPSPSGGNG